MLVNYYSLFTLSEEDDDINGIPNWVRLSRGVRLIIRQMTELSSEMLQGIISCYPVRFEFANQSISGVNARRA